MPGPPKPTPSLALGSLTKRLEEMTNEQVMIEHLRLIERQLQAIHRTLIDIENKM